VEAEAGQGPGDGPPDDQDGRSGADGADGDGAYPAGRNGSGDLAGLPVAELAGDGAQDGAHGAPGGGAGAGNDPADLSAPF
jgi:hypothetical protein